MAFEVTDGNAPQKLELPEAITGEPRATRSSGVGRILYVDLDGTLLATDTLWESVLALLKTGPRMAFRLPLWLLRGKAHLKHQVARHSGLDTARLPYRQDVLEFLKEHQRLGGEIAFATGADRALAERVAREVVLTPTVLASDGTVNLVGERKLKAISAHSGGAPFDYIGNAVADLPIWHAATQVILVQPSGRLRRAVERIGREYRILGTGASRLREFLRLLRVNQWTKNALVFVPLATSHRLLEGDPVVPTVIAAASFSLGASFGYIVNDLVDLDSDREHPSKRSRPLAAGTLSLLTALICLPILLLTSFALAFALGPAFSGILALYIATSVGYSLHFKRIAVLDILVLAGLYTLRVIAGGVATGIPISTWLLAFSMFLFVSFAFVKRFSELSVMLELNRTWAKGRGYRVADADLIRTVGIAAGYLSVLVFALYINSQDVTILYRRPQLLWLVCPLLLYWITRAWLLAHRGEMTEDPVVFTLRDKTSYALGAVIALIAAIAL